MQEKMKQFEASEKSKIRLDETNSDENVRKSKLQNWKSIIPSKKFLDEFFQHYWGFRLEDLTSFNKFVQLLYRPTDPASLGVARALFGLCMVIDVIEERGFSDIDLKWGDPYGCHFPLIHGMRPLSLPWMIVLYTIMWMGAWGIMFGFCFKLACLCFVFPYWYIFLLDKAFWNNHSYLYGIVTLLFWGTGANRYFALDSKTGKAEEKSVPFWNYFIVKFQFFLLYFLAGLKKSSKEWLEGYAMTNLSSHWVFDPFKLLLTTEQTDFLIVHWFGFIFDLTVGFWMLFDKTRIPAMIFCTAFHLMNSRLFVIGMFPYVCLATMPLFCHVDWPRKICTWFSEPSICTLKSEEDQDEMLERLKTENKNLESKSDDEVFLREMTEVDETEKENLDSDELPEMMKNSISEAGKNWKRSQNSSKPLNDHPDKKVNDDFDNKPKWQTCSDEDPVIAWRHIDQEKSNIPRVTKKQKCVVFLLLCHIGLQFFLPYSHFITKGYNNWVPGLYGYSWDMMVHTWDTILVVIRVHDNENNRDHYVDPQAWVQGDRWSKHGDMVRQYAHCLKDNLMRQKQKALTSGRQPVDRDQWARLSSNLSIYIDVWCSLNGRFQQRIFNPNVDMLTAEWNPFKPVTYLMPLLTQFSSYRYKLDEIQRNVYTWSNYTDVLFVADYPEMHLENYINKDLSNVSLTILEGEVAYSEEGWKEEFIVPKGSSVSVMPGKFHKVRTISLYPACYMYTFTNQTKQKLEAEGVLQPLSNAKPASSIMTELEYRLNAIGRTLGHIANAFFYLVYDVPMLRRVRVN